MNQETRTIQVWPSGDGYEYRGHHYGSPTDPARRLRRHKFTGTKPERWREGTPDEWAAIAAEVRVKGYIDREILKCDSMLVTDLLQLQASGIIDSEWSFDNVTGLYPDPSEWTEEKCREWLYEHTSAADNPEGLEACREAVTDNAEPVEVYEWWAITEWLAGELTAIGEPVLDNAYGYWWGRTCTGQAMKMDGTLQKIARRNL